MMGALKSSNLNYLKPDLAFLEAFIIRMTEGKPEVSFADESPMANAFEQPLRKEDLEIELQEYKNAFFQATEGLQAMTFDQCLSHHEISAWISDGRITEERVRELWTQVAASQQIEVLGFEVSNN